MSKIYSGLGHNIRWFFAEPETAGFIVARIRVGHGPMPPNCSNQVLAEVTFIGA